MYWLDSVVKSQNKLKREITLPSEIENKIFSYILNTPSVLGTIAISFLSGHLWAFIIITYLKKGKKGKSFLNAKTGKTAIGLLWFSIIILPIYYISNGTFNIEYEKLLDSVVTTLLFGLALQAIIFALIVSFKGEQNG